VQFGIGNGWVYRALPERIGLGVACSVAGAGAGVAAGPRPGWGRPQPPGGRRAQPLLAGNARWVAD